MQLHTHTFLRKLVKLIPLTLSFSLTCAFAANLPGTNPTSPLANWQSANNFSTINEEKTPSSQSVADATLQGQTVIIQHTNTSNYHVNIPGIASFIGWAVNPETKTQQVVVKPLDNHTYYITATPKAAAESQYTYLDQPAASLTDDSISKDIKALTKKETPNVTVKEAGLLTKPQASYATWDLLSTKANKGQELTTYTANFYLGNDLNTYYTLANTFTTTDTTAKELATANKSFANVIVPSFRSSATVDFLSYAAKLDKLSYQVPNGFTPTTNTDTKQAYADANGNIYSIEQVPIDIKSNLTSPALVYAEMRDAVLGIYQKDRTVNLTRTDLVLSTNVIGYLISGYSLKTNKHFMALSLYPQDSQKQYIISYTYTDLPQGATEQDLRDVLEAAYMETPMPSQTAVYANLAGLNQQ